MPTFSQTSWWWLPSLAAAMVGLLVALTPLNERISQPLFDAQLKRLAPGQTAAGTLVIDIDDASLSALRPVIGPWPFKRDLYALVIEHLREAGARAIAIDLVLADTLAGDLALARALQRPGAPVVLAAVGSRYLGEGSALATTAATVAPAVPAATLQQSLLHLPAQHWPAAVLPAEDLLAAARGHVGFVTSVLDDDGKLRAQHLWHEVRGQRWPSMPLALWAALHPHTAAPPWAHDGQGRIIVAFAGDADLRAPLRFASLVRVALGEDDGGALKRAVAGQVIFIGSSSLLADNVLTVAGQRSGADVLAQSYASLRDNSLVRRPSPSLGLAALAWALLPALWLARRRAAAPMLDSQAMLLSTLLLLVAAEVLLQWQHQTSFLAAPLLTLFTGWAMAMWLHQRSIQREGQRLAQVVAVANEANRAKSEFLANVSHEIRTPMNALMGVAELLQQSELQPEQRRQVQIFREQGGALQRLIDELLDLSKIEAGRFELNQAPFALSGLVERVQALMTPRAQALGLQLEVVHGPGLPAVVLGDEARLAQALQNLLGNAIKFTASGRVSLRVQRDPGQSDGFEFIVADTGIGIAADKLESVFEPFAQADGSVTRRFGGTGLGLTLARQFARLMQGDVAVRSTPGAGSEFTLSARLPASDAALLAPPELARGSGRAPVFAPDKVTDDVPATVIDTGPASTLPQDTGPWPPRRVLLAEDNEVNAYIFCAMLRPLPVQVDVVDNGLQALASLREGHYDIAFLDVQMPGLDGLSVAKAIRDEERGAATASLADAGQGPGQGVAPSAIASASTSARQQRPRLPLVALTANAFADDVKDSLAAGCDRHIPKPFSQTQLWQALHELTGCALPPAAAKPLSPSSA